MLLVSTIRAMREPLHCGASDEASAPRFFLCVPEPKTIEPPLLGLSGTKHIATMPANEKQWSSATPGLLIIMIDQSGSMLSRYDGSVTRTVFASRAVNRIIETIIEKNFDGRAPKNRCFIALIGYNHNVKNIASGYLKELDENPIRVETVKQKISDGAGGLLEIDKSMPIWVEPITQDGATNMKGAFEMAKEIIEKWISGKPNNPAPVIINISDGVPYFQGLDVSECMKQTIAVVNEIKAIDTTDGKVQIFNAMIGDGTRLKKFPKSEDEMQGDDAKFLFEISTEIPSSYKTVGEAKFGMTIEDGARGAVFDVEGVDLINLIDFGSTKAQGDI